MFHVTGPLRLGASRASSLDWKRAALRVRMSPADAPLARALGRVE